MASNVGVGRRRFVRVSLGALAATPFAARAYGQAGGALPQNIDFRRLVAANRILARESVVDAFGHISVRDPENPKRYVMARSRAPELVEHADLIRFEQDGRSLDPANRTPYGERMIHGAIYEARSDIHSVVHNHAYSLLPFGITGRAVEPMVHVASVIGTDVPTWDLATKFGDTDMLVRTMDQGRDLAATLGKNSCALMRGHGAVVAAASIKEAVMIAIYLKINAEIQLQAMELGTPRGLSDREVELSRATQFSPLALDRAWEYFCARAGVEPI
jgi:HCOMODA/2-hydroxy-3-carboxy-muconic semialdehyde decarboxylase